VSPSPRVLLLEDDPVSAEFLLAALAPLPLELAHAASLAQARRLLGESRIDLLLLDLALPDGSGRELLPADGHGPALALTAELDAGRRAGLMAQGFADALAKPIAASALREAVASRLGLPPVSADAAAPLPACDIADWDDTAALTACGSAAVVDSLRGLLRQELPLQLERIRSALAEGHAQAALDELHRLRASCGFCGAAALAAAGIALAQAIRAGADADAPHRALEGAAARLLGAG
jgi:DNA-binding response OmpR family regulator